MRTIHVITGLLLAGAVATGCTRETEIIAPTPYPVGGKGGKAILRVTPRHHLKNIDTCWIYVKYNSKQEPAKYDDSMKVEMKDGRPMVIFDKLRKGDYFIMAKGWNWEIVDSNKIVMGGSYFTIPDDYKIEGKDTFSRTYDVFQDVLDSKNK